MGKTVYLNLKQQGLQPASFQLWGRGTCSARGIVNKFCLHRWRNSHCCLGAGPAMASFASLKSAIYDREERKQQPSFSISAFLSFDIPTILFYSFFLVYLQALSSSYQRPQCLRSSQEVLERLWYLPLPSNFLPLFLSRYLSLLSLHI